MISVKSIELDRIMSRYDSTRAKAMNKTKCAEATCFAAQIVSHMINTSSYSNSGKNQYVKRKIISGKEKKTAEQRIS